MNNAGNIEATIKGIENQLYWLKRTALETDVRYTEATQRAGALATAVRAFFAAGPYDGMNAEQVAAATALQAELYTFGQAEAGNFRPSDPTPADQGEHS